MDVQSLNFGEDSECLKYTVFFQVSSYSDFFFCDGPAPVSLPWLCRDVGPSVCESGPARRAQADRDRGSRRDGGPGIMTRIMSS